MVIKIRKVDYMADANTFESKIFPTKEINIGGEIETVVPGGRNLFEQLPKSFKGIKQIGVIGWSSQAPAQAQNLRDSLDGTDIKVVVGLRNNSHSIPSAEAAGFNSKNGTLGEMYKVISESDLTLLLIADGAQVDNWEKISEAMKPGSCLGLSHGFLVGYLKSIGKKFRTDIDIIGVCPKGMGPSVRRLYEQGRTINGAGINNSFAVQQDYTGNAREIALGWSVGLGAPFTFQTTLEKEYRSDIFGERAILLGAVHGIVEVLYRYFRDSDMSDEEAYLQSVESITGPISHTISKLGLNGVYSGLSDDKKEIFDRTYSATYFPMQKLMAEMYDEISSGRELGGVVDANHRMEQYPMAEITNTPMWKTGEKVRSDTGKRSKVGVNPVTAGVYIAGMMAQVDLLRSKGHAWSEIANESIIEAVDSLNPYMAARGVAYMIDNCSTTARLGARKWGPQFDHRIMQEAIPKFGDPFTAEDKDRVDDFREHTIHSVMETVGKLRPSVDISVAA